MSVPVDAAATVVLLRAGDDPLEVFLLQRNHDSGFVPGAHLFPGGAVDAEDGLDEVIERSVLDADRAADLLGRDDAAWFWVAAVRETFEEAGLLLAERTDGTPIEWADPDVRRRFDDHRVELDRGRRLFADVCAAEDLRLRTDLLHPFARWITPLGAPRRYDTRFFVATAPDEPSPSHDGVEAIDSLWATPRQALERFDRGDWLLIDPTERTLRALARFASAPEALDAVAAASRNGKPEMVDDQLGIRVRLPFDDERAPEADRQEVSP